MLGWRHWELKYGGVQNRALKSWPNKDSHDFVQVAEDRYCKQEVRCDHCHDWPSEHCVSVGLLFFFG